MVDAATAVTGERTCSDLDEERFRRALRWIVAAGALTRVAIWAAKWNRRLSLNDSFYYSVQAAELAHGHLYVEPFTPFHGAEHPPLTSTLMALVSWIGHDPVRWQRLVTTACGVATIAAIGALGRAVGGRRVGLVAAALAVVYPNLWMNDGLVMSESVSILAVVVTLIVLRRALERPGPARWAWCGVAIGVATLARSELVLLVPLGAALLAVGGRTRDGARAWRPVAALVAASALTLAPWVVFNLVRFERPVLLTTNDGTTLAGAYCPQAFSGPGIGGWSILCLADADQALEPSVRADVRRADAERYLRAHAGAVPKVVAARILRTADLYGLHDLVFQDVGEERWRWASWSGIVSFWLLAPVAAFGLTRLRRRARWLLFAPVAVVLVTTVVFYGAHRIRSSAEPTVVVGAAMAVVGGRDRAAARTSEAAR